MDSSRKWNKEMVHEFGVYKPLMWSLGIWPLETSGIFTYIRIFFVIIMQIMMIANIFIEISRFQEASIDTAVDYLALLGSAIVALVKVSLIRLHYKDLLENIDSAANDWAFVKKQEYRQIMLQFTNLGRTVFFLQIISCYFVTIILILSPLLSPDIIYNTDSRTPKKVGKELPYGSPCIHTENSTSFCTALFVCQSIQLFTTPTGNIGIDVFIFGIAMHLCGQFDVLGEDLRQFAIGNEIIGRERNEIIVKIKRHCVLLNLAEHIQDTLHFILLIQLFLNAIDICLLGVQLTVSWSINNYVLAVRTLIALYILMLQLFLYSYMGESLSTKIGAIMNAVYFSNWYTLPTAIVKDLYFIMARAEIPFYITAGKFYNMNINNFKNILKASISYFSVLSLMLTE